MVWRIRRKVFSSLAWHHHPTILLSKHWQHSVNARKHHLLLVISDFALTLRHWALSVNRNWSLKGSNFNLSFDELFENCVCYCFILVSADWTWKRFLRPSFNFENFPLFFFSKRPFPHPLSADLIVLKLIQIQKYPRKHGEFDDTQKQHDFESVNSWRWRRRRLLHRCG